MNNKKKKPAWNMPDDVIFNLDGYDKTGTKIKLRKAKIDDLAEIVRKYWGGL